MLHFWPEISNCDCQAWGPGWAEAETPLTWAWQSSAKAYSPSIVTGEAFHLRWANVHYPHFTQISPIAVCSPSQACEILWSSYSSPTTSGQVPIAQSLCIFVLKISDRVLCTTPLVFLYTEHCTLDALRTPALSEMFTLNPEKFPEIKTEKSHMQRKEGRDISSDLKICRSFKLFILWISAHPSMHHVQHKDDCNSVWRGKI